MEAYGRGKEDEVFLHKIKGTCNDMVGSPPEGTNQKTKGKDQNVEQDGEKASEKVLTVRLLTNPIS